MIYPKQYPQALSPSFSLLSSPSPSLSSFFCVFMFVHMYAWAHISITSLHLHICKLVHCRGQRSSFLRCLPLCFLKQGLSLGLEFIHQTRLPRQWPSGTCPSLPYQCCAYKGVPPCLDFFFFKGFEVGIQFLIIPVQGRFQWTFLNEVSFFILE